MNRRANKKVKKPKFQVAGRSVLEISHQKAENPQKVLWHACNFHLASRIGYFYDMVYTEQGVYIISCSFCASARYYQYIISFRVLSLFSQNMIKNLPP